MQDMQAAGRRGTFKRCERKRGLVLVTCMAASRAIGALSRVEGVLPCRLVQALLSHLVRYSCEGVGCFMCHVSACTHACVTCLRACCRGDLTCTSGT